MRASLSGTMTHFRARLRCQGTLHSCQSEKVALRYGILACGCQLMLPLAFAKRLDALTFRTEHPTLPSNGCEFATVSKLI